MQTTQCTKNLLRPTARLNRRVRHAQAKMYVPSDSFGGMSPERKSATMLRTMFTFISARIVMAQLEGSGRGSLGAYDKTAFDDLESFLHDKPMRDGDAWLSELLHHNRMLGLRILEVRDAYCMDDFEWHQLESLAKKGMKEANLKLMRSYVTASMKMTVSATEGDDPLPPSPGTMH